MIIYSKNQLAIPINLDHVFYIVKSYNNASYYIRFHFNAVYEGAYPVKWPYDTKELRDQEYDNIMSMFATCVSSDKGPCT